MIVPVAGDERLPRCLGALARQTIERLAYEVPVADDAGSEETRRLASAAGAVYLRAPGGGAYAARNAGARHARGDILAFTDSDCVAPPGWLAVLCAVLAREAVDVAVGPSYALNADPIGLLVQAVDDLRWAALARESSINYCDTRNLAGRRDLFLREPFDETFRHGGISSGASA